MSTRRPQPSLPLTNPRPPTSPTCPPASPSTGPPSRPSIRPYVRHASPQTTGCSNTRSHSRQSTIWPARPPPTRPHACQISPPLAYLAAQPLAHILPCQYTHRLTRQHSRSDLSLPCAQRMLRVDLCRPMLSTVMLHSIRFKITLVQVFFLYKTPASNECKL